MHGRKTTNSAGCLSAMRLGESILQVDTPGRNQSFRAHRSVVFYSTATFFPLCFQ